MNILFLLAASLIVLPPAVNDTSSRCTFTWSTAVAYTADSIFYYNADSSIRFGATIRIPRVAHPCPAVFLVSGTGRQNREGTMAGHKMFAVLADYLASHGIAVLCADDRGTGLTSGDYARSTTEDFASDAIAAIRYLETRKEVAHSHIGLIGHSEGGAAMTIAASRCKAVAYLVGLAGLCSKGLASLIRQNEDLVKAAGIPDYNKKRYNTINTILFHTAYQYATAPNLDQKLRLAYTHWHQQDSVYFQTLNQPFDHFFYPIEGFIQQATSAWYRYFVRYDPSIFLAGVSVPILALNGDKDVMVNYQENLGNWIRYSAAAGNTRVDTLVLPGVNHLFQHCAACTPAEYTSLTETFAPEALAVLTSWIHKQTYP